MPELPEVETVANGVNARVRGDRIERVWLGPHIKLFKPSPDALAAGLEGRTIAAVHRTGKHIVFELEPTPFGLQSAAPAQWIVHLGMTGRLLVTSPKGPVAPHTHLRLQLTSPRELRFVDPRRFGRLEFRDLGSTPSFAAAGQEPLTIGKEPFANLFHGRKLSIKAALLNQSLLTGVGNIYADESLFRAGVRPGKIAGRLTCEELERLRQALRRVLKEAIRLGGSSVSDYVDADGQQGFFQFKHRVYRRGGQPCAVCQTPIRRIELAGRSAHFCPVCQH